MTRGEYGALLDRYVCCQLAEWLRAEKQEKAAIQNSFSCAQRCIERREQILEQMNEEGRFSAQPPTAAQG